MSIAEGSFQEADNAPLATTGFFASANKRGRGGWRFYSH